MFDKLIRHVAVCSILLSGATARFLWAQTAPAAPPANTAVNVEVPLYHLFFRSTAVLSRKADELDRSNGGGAALRRAFALKLGVTSAEAIALLTTATALDAQIAILDQQAAALIKAAKAQRQPGKLVPPPPLALTQLEQSRTALVRGAMNSLPQQVTSQAADAINRFLHSSASGAASVSIP